MKKKHFNSKNKGVILIITLIIAVVISVLTEAYFVATISEKQNSDKEIYYLKALSLAEAGLNYAIVDLEKKISVDLKNNIENVTKNKMENDLENYYQNNFLQLLKDYLNLSENGSYSINGSLTTGYYIANINITNQSKFKEGEIYRFFYNYTIESTGTANLTDKKVKMLGGNFTVTVLPRNFATFALFTSQQKTPNNTIVWFTKNTKFTGPIHTNDRFSFAGNPAGIFTDTVTQHLKTARFYNNGATKLLDADSNPPYDFPSFSKGFTREVEQVTLPSSVNQNDLLRQATGNRAPGSFTSNGIYLPNTNQTLDGGIYIRGDASNFNMSVDDYNRPVYIITQGSNTKRITIDYLNNTTIVENIAGSGGTPAGNYTGIPDGINNEGIIVYGNGKIENFSGIVQNNTKIIVSSDSDIVINNHIKYQNYTQDDPNTEESELSAEGFINMLGILSWNGNVRISTSAPNNLEIHAIVMANRGVFTVDNYNIGSPRGIVTLLGGMITNFYGPFGTFSGDQQLTGYGRNFVYDTRVSKGAFPPYFPYTEGFTSIANFENKFIYIEE